MSGLREDDGWAEEGFLRALGAGLPPQSGGGGVRGGRGAQSGRGRGEGRDEADESGAGRPEDRPWTPIPRQAKSADPSLIPPQRRLKKTSRSA